MAKRNIVWTRTADLQFVGILEYWVKRNNSIKFSKKLLRLVTEKQIIITAFWDNRQDSKKLLKILQNEK